MAQAKNNLSPFLHRTMAMKRVAWINHQNGDRPAAYQAYRELERFTRSNKLRATCQVECIGLLMELAESAKGSHEEVRNAITLALSEIPETDTKNRALAELMQFETYERQPDPDFTTAAQLAEQFLAKYSAMNDESLNRELATASFQLGFYYLELNDIGKARTQFQKTIADFPEDSTYFAYFHPHAEALNGLAHIAVREGKIAESKQIMKQVVENYPDSQIAGRILESYPNIAEPATGLTEE